MDTSYASIIADYDLGAMRDRLNQVCNGEVLTLSETQEIRAMVERMAHVQNTQRAIFETSSTADVRPIPGFAEIAVYKHGPHDWRITDRTDPTQEPHTSVIGPMHRSYGAACAYAVLWYSRAYN